MTQQTKISVQLINVTPALAENYLKYNPVNRKVSKNNVAFLSQQMKSGLFVENGESIVFDTENILKDGQHRLLAIVKSGKSYHIPIVKGVRSVSMATYDTGKNRSAADVLSIYGFKNCNKIASLIKSIDKYFKRKSKAVKVSSGARAETLSNQEVLEYTKDNYDWLTDMVKNSTNIYNKGNYNVLPISSISLIAFIIGGKNPSNEVYNFLKHLIGVLRTEETATSYLYNKLYNSKINKEPLNFYWVLGMSIKSWNYYVDGNPSVRYYTFKVGQELPTITKSR